MIAPFPPTPCQVVRCEWSDGYVSEYVGDSPRTSSEYVSSVYDAIAVPRAQWEAAERVGKALRAYEAFDDYSYEKSPNRCDDFCAACDEYEAALAHFATFFPEAP